MKITNCNDGFVAEIHNDEDFNEMVNLLTGMQSHARREKRINKWLDEVCSYIDNSFPPETSYPELPYMYSALAARILAQVVEWTGEDIDEE